uniref:SFR19-like C-terminal domain-containing protein n=1 Tax=Anopheles epiroticus TaxID=199890 RepID=A0A182P086_9DIPT
MRITRYSRSGGRGDYYQRNAGKPFRRRGAHNGGHIPQREYIGSHNQPPGYYPYYGHGERRARGPSSDGRLSVPHERTTERPSRERYRTDDYYSRHSVSRERSLSSVLSDISSGSSCFGTVRASEAYDSPAYEELTDENLRSLEAMTDSSMDLSLAPPPAHVRHKKRKKDKRKKEKARERERKRAKKDKRRQKEILEERICPPEHDVAQSKEIFASGQNILVSVSFIDNEKTKDRSDRHKRSKRKKTKREKTREKLVVTKEERASDAAASARSPRRNSSPSSAGREQEIKDVKEKYNLKQQQHHQQLSTQSEQEKGHEQQEQQQQQPEKHPLAALQSLEPKQPASKKKKLDPGVKPVMVIDLERSPSGQVISSPKEVIVLSDEEGKRVMTQRSSKEETKSNEADQSNRGPNTPPEPAPKSPDSYDPFEPTKSSPSTAISRHDMGSISSLSFLDHHTHHKDDQQKEAKGDFQHHSLGLHRHQPPHLHHHHHHHHHHPHHPHHGHSHHGHGGQERSMAQTDPTGSGAPMFGNDDGVLDLHPESPFDKMNPLINSSPSRTTATTSHHPYHHLNHPSPMKAIIKSMPKKLLASGGGGSGGRETRTHGTAGGKSGQASGTPVLGGTTSGGATTSGGVPFEDELNNDGDISPYSPRSSDCDEQLFEPPNPEGDGETQTIALTVDNLRKVFGNDPKTLYGDLRKSYQHRSVIAVDEMYKPHKMTLEMLDEIPDSAVDMQVKEKLIKKLQRQERIVEEVKHFLKPHFNKKRIDKDEYKEIMRKSIPKICHSRSGEINPAKIQALITAYVKKAIAKRKLMGGEGSASGTPMVNPTSYGLPPVPAAGTSTTTAPMSSMMLMNR